MTINTKSISNQLEELYSLKAPICTDLNTEANDAIEVVTDDSHFALKLYNPASRTSLEVQWEIDLTLHLYRNGVPVAEPVSGKDGFTQTFTVDGVNRVGVLFKWATGTKPIPEKHVYLFIGRAAALIHQAADTFSSTLVREKYDIKMLIDEQIERMEQPLIESGQQQRVLDLTQRLKEYLENSSLDWGVCHMDLTPDNVHRQDDEITVFDLDSAGECWRASEAWRVKKESEEYFQSWLEGYRTIKPFGEKEEEAVSAFVIVQDIRNIVWRLGLANSSRGTPLMKGSDLPKVVDDWLEWERVNLHTD